MINSHLIIKDLELAVFLGWSKKEHAHKQIVLMDVSIYFPTPPKACETDQLDDTICYHKLIDSIQEKIGAQPFHLVEYLARTIFQLIQPLLPSQATLSILIKKQPLIEGLTGGIQFCYGNHA